MQKHLAIIGTVWPEPTSTAAGSRMLQIIDLFQKQNFKITFLCSASKTDYSYNLENLNIETTSIELNSESFNKQIDKLEPDVVLYDRFMTEEQYGWRVAEACPNTITILDTEDLHFLRKAREIAFKQNRELTFEDYISDVFKRELASIYRCDLSLIISEYEMELLTKTFKVDTAILYYLPFLIDDVNTIHPNFSERKHFVSIGNFFHEPNWQTVLQLKKLWKSIKKELPEAELHIYGAYTSDKVNQLHNAKEGFIVKGRANDVSEIFTTYKVLLAPIPFGAGLKGKLFESMQYGLPNVTSTTGVEAMQFENLWNGYITNDEKEFIDKAILLYANENLWNEYQQDGYTILDKKFKTFLFQNEFSKKVDYLLNNLKKHRQQNFLGQVFQHQSLQSTKFMSKWIELKNLKN